MSEKTWPFQHCWFSFDLPGYRPCNGTYCYYKYESIPPLDTSLFTGDLGWLKAAGPASDLIDEEYEEHQEGQLARKAHLEKLVQQASDLGLVLPEAFLSFMNAPELALKIPSCTACEFQGTTEVKPYPGDEGGYVIRFLNDQQDVLMWYLYLTTDGEHCVLVSSIMLDKLDDPDYFDDPSQRWESSVIAGATAVCSPSFEEFLYRFYLENLLWFKLDDMDTLPPHLIEQAERYLAHYASKAS